MDLLALLLLVGATAYSGILAKRTDQELANTWTATQEEKLRKRRAWLDACFGSGVVFLLLIFSILAVRAIPDEVILGPEDTRATETTAPSVLPIGP